MKDFKDCTVSTISSLGVVKVFKDCMISTISKDSSLGVVKVYTVAHWGHIANFEYSEPKKRELTFIASRSI